MPPQRRSKAEDTEQDTDAQPAEDTAAEDTAQTDGPKIVQGPTGTIVDPNDPSIGTLRVKVNSNVTLGNTQYGVDPNKVVEVPDTAETRATLAAGHLTLADGKE